MNLRPAKAELTECDREPIHLISAIQDFGALVAVTSDWMLTRYSQNLADVLGIEIKPEIGMPLSDILEEEAIAKLAAASRRLGESSDTERMFGLRLRRQGELFDAAVHKSERHLVIEFEPHVAEDYASNAALMTPIGARLARQNSVAELSEVGAEMLRQLLGYDRVMVYKFHPDGSGEVIAENKSDELPPFLNLRYPKTDIPKQARELFRINRLRIIADMEADPVPLLPESANRNDPLDLSLSTLRSHSEVHVEYMRNMGVSASMAVSIVRGGELWGMFACHHSEPRVLPYSLRTLAELFAQLFALSLDNTELGLEGRLRDESSKMHDRLMSGLTDGAALSENLAMLDKMVGDLIPHHGASIYVDGSYVARGDAPTMDEFKAIVPELNALAPGKVLTSTSIANEIEAAQTFADRAAGALIIPVSRRPRDYFVLWRKELRTIVNWAGKPEKLQEDASGSGRISPRKSFEAWQEMVTGVSEDWSPAELRVAEQIRVTLLEVVLKLTDQAVRERTRAQEQQDLLIAELNHRVRNILNLIRSLISQSRHDAVDIGTFSKVVGGRIDALAKAHDNITRENWSPASIRQLIKAEGEAFLSGKADRITVTGPDHLIAPEAYTVLALVLHEMMTNSAKYGALCDSTGRLLIDLKPVDDGDLLIEWREIGGPAVKPPQRRGFGSTIIEKSIPHELKGAAEVRYKLSGVEGDFIIPRRFFTVVAEASSEDDTSSQASDAASDASPSNESDGKPARVLVVEDNMIIALDTEETLQELGVKDVVTANSVEMALGEIEKAEPDMAILDYNLGDQTSDPIAEELSRRGVKFVFATGYGETSESLKGSGAFKVIVKPYSREDIANIL